MRTADLINALAADTTPAGNARSSLLRVVPLAVVVLAIVMGSAIGLRPDATEAMPAIAMKLSITLSLATIALMLLLAMSVHLNLAGRLSVLAIVPVFALAFVVMDLVTNSSAGAMTRLVGTKSSHCLVLIPALSSIPLAGFLAAARHGMPASPAGAGALAGLAAAGIGASFYALNCMEDSPLFVAFWYSIATLIVTGAGAALGSRLLRW
ncbi:MAG TPA: NrsF family protein [Beijerinckiaceae bacterium]|nr:NrsF family protein [Beijerinckiaceae bacterium]